MRLTTIIIPLIPAIVNFGTGYWAKLNHSRQPYRSFAGSGQITPGKVSAYLFCGILLASTIIGVAATIYGMRMIGSVWIVLSLTALFSFASSLGHSHDVIWNKHCITGVCSWSVIGPASRRTSMDWHKIVRVGKNRFGYWYISDDRGVKIYWSYLYPGYGHLMSIIRSRRPDLPLIKDFERSITQHVSEDTTP